MIIEMNVLDLAYFTQLFSGITHILRGFQKGDVWETSVCDMLPESEDGDAHER